MPLIDFMGSTNLLDPKLTYNPTPSSGGGGGSGTLRKFFNDLLEDYVEPTPVPSSSPVNLGFVRTVNSITDWNNLPSVVLPGDVIRIATNIPGTLIYRGSSPGYGGAGPFPDGTEEAPITITCAPGVWIDPNNPTGVDSGLDIIRSRHIHVIGANVRNCRFPIRFITSGGTSGHPARVHHNECMGANEANLHITSLADTGLNVSSYITVLYNKFHSSTGYTPYNDGVLIGTNLSSFAWKDKSHDIEVAYNEIYGVRGSGTNIIPGAYNIFVHHNAVHDIGGDQGAGISACIKTSTWPVDPNPGTVKPVWIWSNWIWNIGYAFNGISGMAQGIRANFAGMLVFNNVIWSCAVKGGGNTRGINADVYATVSAFASTFFNNTIWVDDSITNTVVAGADDFYFFENITYDGSLLQGTATFTNDFLGPSIAINPTTSTTSNATADAGYGPGSAFLLKPGSSHIDSVVTTDPLHRTTDASGISIPVGAASDRGAYEYL